MENGGLTLGMIGSSTKENEKRVAIHPAHFPAIDAESRKRVFVEKGYGKNFRIADEEIAPQVAGLLEREEIFAHCDIVMIFKPTAADFPFFREGQVMWGALHLVQGVDITQMSIDKKLTCIAMESMYIWKPNGDRGVWLFHSQSELAGYCSVLHSLQLLGTKGWYDQPRKIAVISFGASGRGAIHACNALDYSDLTVFTMRSPQEVLCTIPGVKYGQYVRDPEGGPTVMFPGEDGTLVPFAEELSRFDIIVNCVFQDTDNPFMFVMNQDLDRFRKGTLIVDVSCDRGMGFEFARPTTFDDPMFEVGRGVTYYAVDHSPSHLFNTASLEHSKVAYQYVHDMLGGPDAWQNNPTIGRAIEIEKGVVQQKKILSYQGRAEEYPHTLR